MDATRTEDGGCEFFFLLAQAFLTCAVCRWPWPPCLPASLSSALPDPWALPLLLRRRSVPPPTHPPPCAGSVPAAAHHHAASLVLPQVNAAAHRTSASPAPLPPPPTPGCEPGLGAELRVTNTSSFSHRGGAGWGSCVSSLPLKLSENRQSSCSSDSEEQTSTFRLQFRLSTTSANEKKYFLQF